MAAFLAVLGFLQGARQIFPGAGNGSFLENAWSRQFSVVLNSDTAMWAVGKASTEKDPTTVWDQP